MSASFVDNGFAVPVTLFTEQFVLEPLGPEHNESDYAAWTSSIAHIRSTPGFARTTWPYPMSLEQNKADLDEHAREFRERIAFAYTVLDPHDRSVVGASTCVRPAAWTKRFRRVRMKARFALGCVRNPATWTSPCG